MDIWCLMFFVAMAVMARFLALILAQSTKAFHEHKMKMYFGVLAAEVAYVLAVAMVAVYYNELKR